MPTTPPQLAPASWPVLLLGFALLVLLAAERIRSALVAQTRQQRAHALSELALQRELHARQIQFTVDEAFLAVRQVLHDALGAEPVGLQLVRGATSAPLVLRDALRWHYALTPYSTAAQAIARTHKTRVIELTPAVTSLFVADELTVATRTLLGETRTLPRSATWYLVRYNPTPEYRLHKPARRWFGQRSGGRLPA